MTATTAVGTGNTSALSILVGLAHPTAGEARVLGLNVLEDGLDDRSKTIA